MEIKYKKPVVKKPVAADQKFTPIKEDFFKKVVEIEEEETIENSEPWLKRYFEE